MWGWGEIGLNLKHISIYLQKLVLLKTHLNKITFDVEMYLKSR